jgi:Uma2 family endonuclease
MEAGVVTARRMTAEELAELPDDGQRYELVRGELRSMPPVSAEHAWIVGWIARLLGEFVDPRGLGIILAGDPGFTLFREPDTVLAPDLAFIRADRLPPPEQLLRFQDYPPDLVIEVVSPSDRAGDIRAKILDYLRAGVRLIWIVYPRRRAVAVHVAGAGVRQAGEDDELDGGDVLPGFRVRVADLFPTYPTGRRM